MELKRKSYQRRHTITTGGPKGGGRRRKRVRHFIINGTTYIGCRDTELLKHSISECGKILPHRVTGTLTKYQRMLTTAIKCSCHMALLPYIEEE